MNQRVSAKSFPKINLALDILNFDPTTGYHEIQTVFHELREPFDEIEIEETEEDEVVVFCDNKDVPVDENNTAHLAATLLKDEKNIASGVKIHIKKKIPVMGGLGGGSSNAAAVLKLLGEIWIVDGRTLKSIAAEIGMDTVFFLEGGCAIGGHYGERLSPLPPLPLEIKFEVIDTGIKIPTAWVYSKVDLKKCGRNIGNTEKLIEAIVAQDANGILENLHNDFEEFIFAERPELRQIKQKLEDQKSGGKVLLCGSGGCLTKVSLAR